MEPVNSVFDFPPHENENATVKGYKRSQQQFIVGMYMFCVLVVNNAYKVKNIDEIISPKKTVNDSKSSEDADLFSM